MPSGDDVANWLKSIDLFQLAVVVFIVVYIFNFVLKKFLPSVATLNEIVNSVKDLPEDIPTLKLELEKTKKIAEDARDKAAAIEERLDQMVADNLLPREGELDGNLP